MHRSEVSEGKSYNEGDTVKIRVLNIDPDERKISVSARSYDEQKARGIADDYAEDDSSTVKMSDLMN